jgi:hemoglobin
VSPGNDSRDHRRSSAPSLDAAVTEAMIHDLVHAFYARVRQDAALGPIFHRAVRDWDAHLSKLCDFWSAIMLGTGRFKGAPVAVHAQLPAVHAAHFAQWLLLFRQTAWEACPPDAAALFIARSEIIAESLQSGIAANRAALAPSARRVRETP